MVTSNANTACGFCDENKETDSGGVTPEGFAIMVECPHCQPPNNAIQDELLSVGASSGKIPPAPKTNVTELG